jgi:hypothetical protein
MKFHYGIVLGLMAAALAGCNWPPQPRTPVNLPPPIEIAQVHSLAELKAQPLISVAGNWQVRLGWADSGPDGGPWKLVYCYAEYLGRDRAPKIPAISRGQAVTLGPVQVLVTDPDSSETAPPVLGPGWDLGTTIGREGVFCATVPAAWPGRYRLSVFDAQRQKVAETILEIEEPQPCYWQELADLVWEQSPIGPQSAVALDPAAVRPTFESLRPVWNPGREAETKQADATPGLPGQVPGARFWMGDYALSAAAGEDPRGLSLTRQGRNLLIQSRLPIFLGPDMNMAARWWVNGEAVEVGLSDTPVLDTNLKMPEGGTEMRVGLRLPATLGELRVGDKVAVQVMYVPGRVERILESREYSVVRTAQRISTMTNLPLLSNRLELEVEPWMLVGREVIE